MRRRMFVAVVVGALGLLVSAAAQTQKPAEPAGPTAEQLRQTVSRLHGNRIAVPTTTTR